MASADRRLRDGAARADDTAAAVGGLCRLVLDLRLLAIAFTVLGMAGSGRGSGWVTLALLLVMVTSYLPLRRWQRLGPELLRHPLYLGVDAALAVAILAVAGSSSPFFYFTVGTAILAGILYGRTGAVRFSSALILGYLAVVAFETGSAPDPVLSFQTLLGLPLLYPILAAAGATLRGLLDQQARDAEALRAATEAAAAAEERARLAREMHDSLAKSLHGIALSASALVAWIRRDPELGVERAHELANAASCASDEARRLLSDLRADRLDETFPEAVREIVGRWSDRTGIDVGVDVDDCVDLDPGVRYELACVLRETLTNVELHAGADHVDVRLATLAGQAELQVSDDGKGFAPPDDLAQLASDGHYGVVGMSERASRVDGRLTVLARPGHGTTVRVTAPLAGGEAPRLAETTATTS
ncbi:MAG TPA: histidine kinase [Actinomycetota bacterium]|nr:histidine kinase [Actinomycetota bacterium]